jgi:hypothetical protein
MTAITQTYPVPVTVYPVLACWPRTSLSACIATIRRGELNPGHREPARPAGASTIAINPREMTMMSAVKTPVFAGNLA